jgi:tRNA nucleotidyltransferase (CCA-adding enzyme)
VLGQLVKVDLTTKLRNPVLEALPFDLNTLPQSAYFVGGWVRDCLLGRQAKHLDLDLVMPTAAVETASSLAISHKAGFVLLDQERQIARVVFGNATVDFAQQIGETIAEDLHRRDFCMNAIAISCQELCNLSQNLRSLPTDLPPDLLIDPLHGYHDLQNKLIRMVAPENLLDDPLRVLRGYRQAAQLGFTIEPKTRLALQQAANGLGQVAAERVRTELCYLLAIANGAEWFEAAARDRILVDWLPSEYLNLERLSRMETAIAAIVRQRPQLEDFFAVELSSDRSVRVTAKLAALANSATALEALGFSRIEQRWIVGLLRHLPQFLQYLQSDSSSSPLAQYQLFDRTQEFFPALAAIALASDASLESVLPWLDRWLDPHDPIAHPVVLVGGDVLKTALEIPASPIIGELLTAIRFAQVDGIVQDRETAIAYARKVYLSHQYPASIQGDL